MIFEQQTSKRRATLCIFFVLASFCGVAQERMIPALICDNSGSRGYETSLIELFNIGKASKFAFLVKPSFSPEYCLSYENKTQQLVLKEAASIVWKSQEWYWGDPKERKPNKKIDIVEYRLPFSKDMADSLQRMFVAAVLTSSFMGDTIMGFDGTTYEFIIQPGFSKVATCWSPDEGSNCGQAVAVMEQLCEAVKIGDKELAESLLEEIVRVANLFRQFYPEDFRQEQVFCR